jgi:hypothetical protein
MTQKTLIRQQYNAFYRQFRLGWPGYPSEALGLVMELGILSPWLDAYSSYKMRLTTDPLARSLEQRRAYRHWSEAL